MKQYFVYCHSRFSNKALDTIYDFSGPNGYANTLYISSQK